MNSIRIGLTRDLLTSAGTPSFGEGPLDALGGLNWEWTEEAATEISPDLAAQFDALHVNAPHVTRASVSRPDCRLRIVARHGVGYDAVDVPALTEAGIILTNAPEAVRRPVATMAMTFVLALAQKLLVKDRLTRAGRWAERTDFMGLGLRGKTLGLVGAGGIGRETIGLARAFDMQVIAADPYADPQAIAALGAMLLPLDDVMAQSNFVVVTCLLTPETRHLINADRLARMKPSAYLINVARGPIVDEAALIAALQAGQIAGAGLDVFEQEPVDTSNPLLTMDTTVVSPHALCWTDENFGAIATSALSGIARVAAGDAPRFIVNPEVLDHPRVRAWLTPGR